jgi:putative peptidoglycan lipid II flippase
LVSYLIIMNTVKSPPLTRHHRLARAAGVFTGATIVSRILGYIRDSLVADFFGAGAAADAFYAAFRIANLFRRLLGEGALSASFIPVFSEYAEKQGKERTQEFLNTMFTTLLCVLTTLTVLGVVFAPQITRLIAMGFERTPERFALTVTLTRYMFPFLLFISLAALITGVLNAFRSFFLPALAPASLSLAEMGYIFAIAPFVSTEKQVIGLAISVVVGGFGQFFIHVPALWAKRYSLRLKYNLAHAGVRRVAKLMLPATFGISVDQLNAFVDTICASFLVEGSITALYYANRVMQLPLALFGIALSQVALPSMATSVARGDVREVKETLNFALRLTLFMIVPAMTGLIVLGRPIVKILFEHGRFTAQATALTNWALLFFALGLFAYAAVKILASAFYAYQNTRIPVITAALCVALNIVLNLLLMRPMGVGGLALATATASWVNAGVLYLCLRRKIGLLGGRRIFKTLSKAIVASAVMAVFCWAVIRAAFQVLLVLRLSIAIAGGGMLYLASARLLHMEEWAPFWSMLAREHPLAEGD